MGDPLESSPDDVVEPSPPRARAAQVCAGLALFVIMALRPPAAAFFWDANTYWNGARAVVGAGSVVAQGLLDLRGVLTSLIYVPAALVVRLTGDATAGAAVLIENALLIALIGAVLLPALVGLWRPVNARVVAVCAFGTAVTVSGFAPFPLTDIWAAALVLSTAVLVGRRGTRALLLAGLAAGCAFNIRPATLLPLAAIAVAVVVARRASAWPFVLGGVIALLPQVALNAWRGAAWVPWPTGTAGLTHLQAAYAAYVVRYDTVLTEGVSDPRLFYCSPGMANAVEADPPSSAVELALAFLRNPFEAVVFSGEKMAAALHWPLSVPYLVAAPVLNGVFAIVVTAVTVIGAAGLLRAAVRRPLHPSLGRVAVGLSLLGSLATLITSATETRFALPLVLIGVAGCALLAADRPRVPRSTAARAWVVGSVVAAIGVFVLGWIGMGDPFVGAATVNSCAGG